MYRALREALLRGKNMKKFLSGFLGLTLAVSMAVSTVAVAGCSSDADTEVDVTPLQENLVDDNYDNYYEIFVYSFCDSDGDGVGDIKGITSKLPYIRDMGYTGLWLTPIQSSPTYHKYDAVDYCSIDEEFGTMADFEGLIEEADRLGIKVITDMVFNHTSSNHIWFQNALKAYITDDTDNYYYDFYNFSDTYKSGYTRIGDASIYYESQFDSSMPDLNLDSENVKKELGDVIKFWIDKGVSGFRLDAVMYYFSDSALKSAQFAQWVKDTADEYASETSGQDSDVFVVGEAWGNRMAIKSYYTNSENVSYFDFPTARDGYITQTLSTVQTEPAETFWSVINFVADTAADGDIACPILGNHDTGRIAGYLGRDEAKIKFAYGLVSMLSGNTFTYYGDEIGMIGGTDSDQDKRLGMMWTADTQMIKPENVTPTQQVFADVETQLADNNSILNYYKLCNNVRNAFPSIMRGTAERVDYDDDYVLVFNKSYGNERVTIVINFATESKRVSGISGTLQKGICVSGKVSASGDKLTLPAYSIAVLK